MFSSRLGRRVWSTYFVILGLTILWIFANLKGILQDWGIPDAVVTNITTALLSYLLIGFFSNLLLIRTVQSGIQETVQETLPLVLTSDEDRSIFKSLGPDIRSTIVKQTLRAQLGGRFGELIYRGIVEPYMKEEQDCRLNLVYAVKCIDEIGSCSARSPDIRSFFDYFKSLSSEYLWVSQSIGYTRDNFREDSDLQFLRVQFVFSMGQLEAAVHDHSLFFREVLHVSDEVRQALTRLEPEQLQEFVYCVLNFSATTPAGNQLRWQAQLGRSADGRPLIEIVIENPSSRRQGSGCRIQFCLPHKRDERHFVITMPRPTASGAEITFEKAPSMRELSEFSYLSDNSSDYTIERFGGDSEVGPDVVKVHTLQWMFPMSGIIFFWK